MSLVTDFRELADAKYYLQDTSEIVMNNIFHQNTGSFFDVRPAKQGQQVAAMRGFEYVTTGSLGCGGTGISPKFPAFSQEWNLKPQEVKIQYCYTDFERYYTEWALDSGYSRKDLSSTTLALFIQDLIAKAMALDMQRIVLFGDADIASDGTLNDANKEAYYNTIDKGLIPTLLYLKTLPEFKDYFVELTKNNEKNREEQLNLEDKYAYKLYRDLLRKKPFDSNLLLTSENLFYNYQDLLITGITPLESNVNNIQGGLGNLSVLGKPLTPVINYDRWRENDFTVGENPRTYLPHFALLTRKEHMQVGVDALDALSNLVLEYIGGSEETFWIKAHYMLDFKHTNPYGLRAAL